MKTGFEKRHKTRLQLAIDTLLDMSQKLQEKQEDFNVNRDLSAVAGAVDAISEAAKKIGIDISDKIALIDKIR